MDGNSGRTNGDLVGDQIEDGDNTLYIYTYSAVCTIKKFTRSHADERFSLCRYDVRSM